MNASAAFKRSLKQKNENIAYGQPGQLLFNPTAAAFLNADTYVEDFRYVEEDNEIAGRAQRGVVYAHRLDHAPSCLFLEEAELRVCVGLGLKKNPFAISETVSRAASRNANLRHNGR